NVNYFTRSLYRDSCPILTPRSCRYIQFVSALNSNEKAATSIRVIVPVLARYVHDVSSPGFATAITRVSNAFRFYCCDPHDLMDRWNEMLNRGPQATNQIEN